MARAKKPNPNREAAQRLAKKLADMSEAERAEFASRCPVVLTIEGRPISGKNAMLAMLQCSAVTVIGGFQQWIKAGRAVRKGESAIYIFVPSTRGGGADPGDAGKGGGAGEAGDGGGAAAAAEGGGGNVRFLMAPVFDVSQTDAIEIAAEDSSRAA